jgi:hypothetical protein
MLRDYSSPESKGQVVSVETQSMPDRPDAIAVASMDSSIASKGQALRVR